MKLTMLITVLMLVSCSSREDKEEKLTEVFSKVSEARADMHSTKMKSISGTVIFEAQDGSLVVKTDLKGLKPNAKLGFHIHQLGFCEGPDYKTAGDHYNPGNMKHGGPMASEKHKGDMGNLVTDKVGNAKETIVLTDMKLDDLIGKSVLIHEKSDDFKTQPSGNSGARIACGLIRPIE